MKPLTRTILLIVIALASVLGLISARLERDQALNNIQTRLGEFDLKAVSEASENKNLINALAKIPVNEEIASVKQISNGNKYIIVSYDDSGARVDHKAKIWLVSNEMKLFKEVPLPDFELYSAIVDSSWSGSNVVVNFQGEGPGAYNFREIHVYLDLDGNEVAQATLYSRYQPAISLEVGEAKNFFKLSLKNECKTKTDFAEALIIDGKKFPFAKAHAVTCPDLDQPFPTLPGLGKPAFVDQYMTFGLPWGSEVQIDLETKTISSEDFSKEFALPSGTTSTGF